MEPIILIPIFEPDETTLEFIHTLSNTIDNPIIIVDDGSGKSFHHLFQRMSTFSHITLLQYEHNQGKGYALKYGMNYILNNCPNTTGIITADGDGQHCIEDIARMLQAVHFLPPNTILLGTRNFKLGKTPWKSLIGNRLTSLTFFLSTGHFLNDTQTGLRGFRLDTLKDLINIPGNRFDYEMNVLLNLKNYHLSFKPLPISTIYLNKNKASHFRPFQDSLLIYRPLIKFTISSSFSALLDLAIFSIFSLFLGTSAKMLLCATILARILSGLSNYFLNKNLVFKTTQHHTFKKYLSLFIAQLFLSWLGVLFVSQIIPSVLFSKIITDTLLFFVSFNIQNNVIFKKEGKAV